MNLCIAAVFLFVIKVHGTESPCPTGYSSENGFTPGCTYDPCLPVNYKEIDEWQRSLTNSYSDTFICDYFLEPGWYRPISQAGHEMPTQCPVHGFTCGTAKPIWLNGEYPEAGQTANLTACASSLDDCCAHSYEIQVKNCSTYNVYNLVSTNGCPQAYCFGTELPCPTGYSSENGFTPGCTYDSCLPENHKELDEWERSLANNYSDTFICDYFLEPGWYRPISQAGNEMPTQCPIHGFTCGTAKPIWLNGEYPEDGQTANLTACASSLDDCCAHSYEIQVKNCSTYIVYNLVSTNGCPQSYCFGTQVPCPEGYSSDTGFTPCEFDPCNSKNYAILKNEIKRSANYTLQSSDEPFDDSALVDGWYRVDSTSGSDIVNTQQTINQCGTSYPIWMKGEIPSVQEKTTSRLVCLTGENGNCKSEFFIQIRNCGDFRTYFLKRVDIQYAGYCFGTYPVREIFPKPGSTKEKKTHFSRILIPLLITLTVLTVAMSVYAIHKKCTKKVDVLYRENTTSQALPYFKTEPFAIEIPPKPGLYTSLQSRGFIKA